MNKGLNQKLNITYDFDDVITKTYVDSCLDSTAETSNNYIIDYSKYQSLLEEKEVRKNRIDKLYEIFKD
jgi:hypothetical protein